MGDKNRELAVVSPREKSYFATVEQHLSYDQSKQPKVSEKDVADVIATKEPNVADQFEKLFIAVTIVHLCPCIVSHYGISELFYCPSDFYCSCP